MTIWNIIRNFKKTENWGNADKMNGLLLFLLDKITERVKDYYWDNHKRTVFCNIHCGYELNGHAAASEHKRGNAVDFHFSNASALKCYEIMMEVLQEFQAVDHVGVGIYPDWINPGFHLDVRGEKARWSQVTGKYVDIKRGLDLLK